MLFAVLLCYYFTAMSGRVILHLVLLFNHVSAHWLVWKKQQCYVVRHLQPKYVPHRSPGQTEFILRVQNFQEVDVVCLVSGTACMQLLLSHWV